MADDTASTDTPATATRQRKERTPEDRALLKAMGKAIWRAETARGTTADEKNAAWAEGRRTYASRAGALLKALRREGIEISAPAGSTDADEKSA